MNRHANVASKEIKLLVAQNIIAHNARMDTLTMQIFVEVAEHGSFADVARLRNLSPSSVSRAVAGLEQELAIRLFQRSTRKLELTEAGGIYYEQLLPILESLETAQQTAIDLSSAPVGKLRVTVPVVFGEMKITPLLARFAQSYPQLALELIMSDSYLDLLSERIDVAIRLGSLHDSSYICKRIFNMQFHVCASAQYVKMQGKPRRPTDIANHQCLLFPREGRDSHWVFKHKRNGIEKIAVQGMYSITNSQAVKQCALSDMGIALLPDWLIEKEIKSGALIDLFPAHQVSVGDFESSAWILYPSRAYLPSKVRVFVDFIHKHLSR